MPRSADTVEHTPGRSFSPRVETTQYWLRDDGRIHYRDHPVHGAHAPTFRFYLGAFARDRRHGYSAGRRLSGSDGPSFRALNYAYAADRASVWTMHGALKKADVATFEVCDDGVRTLGSGARVASGFGRDRLQVYYYDHQGKPRVVQKAKPESFESLNDGFHGRDEQNVYCGWSILPDARVRHWRKLEACYSRDDRHVYCGVRRLNGADVESFEVVRAEPGLQLARDRERFYCGADPIDAAEFEQLNSEPPLA